MTATKQRLGRTVLAQPHVVSFESATQRLPVRAFNVAGGVLRRFGAAIGNLDEETLLAAARARSGAPDLGSESWRPALRRLLPALETEARLSPFGRLLARRAILRCLVNRARLERDWARHPEILGQSIDRPLIIVGLPRTGTTFLQGLLAQDPRHRFLAHWEATSPSPPPGLASHRRDPRRRVGAWDVRVLSYLSPNAVAMHEVEPNGPQECVPLLENDFAGFQFISMFSIPTFQRWLETRDLSACYRVFRQQLQLLQWQRPPQRWLLKSSAHLFAPEALLALFPDACIVQLHRHPRTVVASYCSLMATLYAIASDAVDPREIGATWLRTLAHMLEHTMRVRADREPDRFVDVLYRDLVRDPIATVRAIYRRGGDALSAAAESSMRAWLARNPQHKRGVHRYALDAFGLSEPAVRAAFQPYLTAFDVLEETGE